MNVSQLRRELSSGVHRACYCLYGPETFLVEEALSALLEALLPREEREFGVVRLYADEASVDEVLNEARTMPFFSSRRLVVVRRIEAWEGLFSPRRKAASAEEPDQEGVEDGSERAGEDQLDAHRRSLLSYLEEPNPAAHLIFVGRRADARLPVVRQLRDMGALVECTAYSQEAALKWVRQRARTIGCELPREGAALLVECVGPDLQRLAHELDKLAEYGTDGEEITTEVIERLIAGDRERSAFELTDAIARQDVETALRRLDTLLTIGEGDKPMPPLRVLGSLAWQVRRVWLVKDGTRRGLSDIDTYRRAVKSPLKRFSTWHQEQLKALRETAERLSEADLASALRRLLQADMELKGGGTNDRRALETLVIDLCRVGQGEGEGA